MRTTGSSCAPLCSGWERSPENCFDGIRSPHRGTSSVSGGGPSLRVRDRRSRSPASAACAGKSRFISSKGLSSDFASRCSPELHCYSKTVQRLPCRCRRGRSRARRSADHVALDISFRIFLTKVLGEPSRLSPAATTPLASRAGRSSTPMSPRCWRWNSQNPFFFLKRNLSLSHCSPRPVYISAVTSL